MSTNYIDQITDTQSTPVTHDIQEATDFRIFRATCSTAATTAAKVATLQDPKNFSLTTGVRVAVTFQYGNNAASPTLRVDGSSTGTAKSIAFSTDYNLRTTERGTTYNTWGPYETVIFTYDGTYWINGGSGLSIYRAYNADSKVAQNNLADSSEHRVLLSYSANNTDETNTSYKTGNVTVSPGNSSTGTVLKVKGTDSGAGYIQLAAYNSGSPELKLNNGSYTTTILNNTSLASNIAVQLPREGGTLSVKDEKLAIAEGSTNTAYYLLLGSETSAQTRQYDGGITYGAVDMQSSSLPVLAQLVLGNNKSAGTTGNREGCIMLYGSGTKTTTIQPGTANDNDVLLPSSNGTLALTSDIPTTTSQLTNDSNFAQVQIVRW